MKSFFFKWLSIATAAINGCFLAFMAVSKPFFGGKQHKNLCLPGIAMNDFALEIGVAPG